MSHWLSFILLDPISLPNDTPSSGDPIVDWLTRAGPIGILAVAVIGFMKGWIVSGKTCDRLTTERDRAMDLVFKQAEIAQRAMDVAERTKP